MTTTTSSSSSKKTINVEFECEIDEEDTRNLLELKNAIQEENKSMNFFLNNKINYTYDHKTLHFMLSEIKLNIILDSIDKKNVIIDMINNLITNIGKIDENESKLYVNKLIELKNAIQEENKSIDFKIKNESKMGFFYHNYNHETLHFMFSETKVNVILNTINNKNVIIGMIDKML